MAKSLASILLLSTITLSYSQRVIQKKNIPYVSAEDPSFHKKRNRLDVFYPESFTKPSEVLIFIHGGAWRLGNKRMYPFFGKSLARNGKVAVLINYRLKKKITYKEMAADCSNALKWVQENIHQYNGDPEKVFVSGHSAGGHLAALITLDSFYQIYSSPVKGMILIDAFGLDINSFLRTSKYNSLFFKPFTRDSTTWERASPISHVNKRSPPILLFTGERTLKQIKIDNQLFINQCRKSNVMYEEIHVKKKGHITMMFQFRKRKNPLYTDIIRFMERTPHLNH